MNVGLLYLNLWAIWNFGVVMHRYTLYKTKHCATDSDVYWQCSKLRSTRVSPTAGSGGCVTNIQLIMCKLI